MMIAATSRYPRLFVGNHIAAVLWSLQVEQRSDVSAVLC